MKGFTIIELIIIIAILGIVISLFFGSSCVGPRYMCVNGVKYRVMYNNELRIEYTTSGKVVTCNK